MKKAIIFGCLIMLVAACVVVCGCGSSLQGVYKFKTGNYVAVLTLKANNNATYSLTDKSEGIPLTYKVKNGTVVLVGADGKEIATGKFTITDNGLRDLSGNIYKKQ